MRRKARKLLHSSTSDFNPRTPYGMRLSVSIHYKNGTKISIHAPLTGCDASLFFYLFNLNDFNPRTPYGMRLSIYDSDIPTNGDFNPRTPYGMRHRDSLILRRDLEYFNPRTPYGMRPLVARCFTTVQMISIHAPLTGCD